MRVAAHVNGTCSAYITGRKSYQCRCKPEFEKKEIELAGFKIVVDCIFWNQNKRIYLLFNLFYFGNLFWYLKKNVMEEKYVY